VEGRSMERERQAERLAEEETQKSLLQLGLSYLDTAQAVE
jgi:hypothetical protein